MGRGVSEELLGQMVSWEPFWSGGVWWSWLAEVFMGQLVSRVDSGTLVSRVDSGTLVRQGGFWDPR